MGLMGLLKTSALATAATASMVAGLVPGAETPTAGSLVAPGEPGTIDDVASVRGVLSAYETALNASDSVAVMPLYAEDGVFMAPYSPSAVGAAEVRKAYKATFKAITLNVKFHVVEVVQMSPDWAFARTNSAGTVTIHATGTKSTEANQELFIFRKDADGKWKIARYGFSTTNPPSRP